MKRLVSRFAPCVFLASLLLVHGSARAEVSQPGELADIFSAEIAKYLGKSVNLDDTNAAGVPKALITLIEKKYAHMKMKIAPGKQELAKMTKLFNESWAEFLNRKKEVNAAIEKASSQEPSAAIDTLETVISLGKIDAKGKIKRERGLIDASDAETGAVVALAKLYAKTESFDKLALLPGSLINTRKVFSKNSELLIFYQVTTKVFGDLKIGATSAAFNPAKKAATRILPLNFGGGERKHWAKGKRILNYNAKNLIRSFDSLGLKILNPLDAKNAKKNDWVLLRDIRQPSVKGKSFSYKYSDKYKQAYDCKKTKEIEGIDLVTGKFKYKTKCKFRSVHKKASVKAKLLEAAPAWLDSQTKYQPVWVVGRVKKAGPNWVLSQAKLVDLRFMRKKVGGDDF